jgi:hypothetical protein
MHSLLFSSCHAVPSSSHSAVHLQHPLFLSCTSLIFSSFHALLLSSHPSIQFPHLLIKSCNSLFYPAIQLQHLRILPNTSIILLSCHELPPFPDPATTFLG